jgi:hypothetical protein
VVFNTPDKENQNDVMFFLGAGASIEAGVPDTTKFVQGFIEYLEENKLDKELNVLKIILETLKEKGNITIDIELVLGTIIALNKKKNSELVYFYDQSTFKFKPEDVHVLNKLESILKGYIRKNVVVAMSDVRYLEPLKEFKPVNVFSTNYDTCIEMLCTKHKLKYTDGFDSYWNHELFDSDKYDIKLFKLHGSILWYLTNYGNFVKLLPNFVKLLTKKGDETDEIPLITDETAQPFIMYPIGGKLEYHRPLVYLTNKLEKHLKEKETNFCIVVGYSFREDYIKNIFFDSAKENENLTIILIDPNAGTIFNEKLRYRDDEKSIESPLADRVICFNYPFGSVLKNNLYKVKNGFPRISNLYSHAKNEKRHGDIEQFINNIKTCVNVSVEAEHVYFIEKIFKVDLGISPPENWGFYNEVEKFRLSYTLAILYLMNLDKKGENYFKFLRNYLINILEAGRQYFDLNKELMEVIEKKESDEAIVGIKTKIEIYQKQSLHSSFYYWLVQDDLKRAIVSFEDFIQSKLKLDPPNVKFSSLLETTALACQNFSKIFGIQYDTGKYKGSPKVDMQGTKIEIEKKKDLEKGLENIIKKIEEFIEYYKQEV